jgi:hypothetical protein
MEEYMVERLKQYGVLGEYITLRLDSFVYGWYLEKLKLARPEDRKDCLGYLAHILALYGKEVSDYPLDTMI